MTEITRYLAPLTKHNKAWNYKVSWDLADLVLSNKIKGIFTTYVAHWNVGFKKQNMQYEWLFNGIRKNLHVAFPNSRTPICKCIY